MTKRQAGLIRDGIIYLGVTALGTAATTIAMFAAAVYMFDRAEAPIPDRQKTEVARNGLGL